MASGRPSFLWSLRVDEIIAFYARLYGLYGKGLKRRVDALIYLHRICKAWLPPHVATTSLMLALMIVHIVQVIYYASR